MQADPATAAAAAAVCLACLQLGLARWRDLGPATVALGGIALVLAAPAPPAGVGALVAAATVVAAAAWGRGDRHGVGRPVLVVLVGAAAVLAGIAVGVADRVRPEATFALRTGLAASLGMVGLVATTLAIDRKRSRVPPVRWFGRVRVEGVRADPAGPRPP